MTALQEIRMEQRVQELEAKVAELEEVVQAMGRLMMVEQPAQETTREQVPNDITVRHHTDAIDYIKGLGYSLISTGLYMNPDKTVRAQIVLNDKFEYDVKFSRV